MSKNIKSFDSVRAVDDIYDIITGKSNVYIANPYYNNANKVNLDSFLAIRQSGKGYKVNSPAIYVDSIIPTFTHDIGNRLTTSFKMYEPFGITKEQTLDKSVFQLTCSRHNSDVLTKELILNYQLSQCIEVLLLYKILKLEVKDVSSISTLGEAVKLITSKLQIPDNVDINNYIKYSTNTYYNRIDKDDLEETKLCDLISLVYKPLVRYVKATKSAYQSLIVNFKPSNQNLFIKTATTSNCRINDSNEQIKYTTSRFKVFKTSAMFKNSTDVEAKPLDLEHFNELTNNCKGRFFFSIDFDLRIYDTMTVASIEYQLKMLGYKPDTTTSENYDLDFENEDEDDSNSINTIVM